MKCRQQTPDQYLCWGHTPHTKYLQLINYLLSLYQTFPARRGLEITVRAEYLFLTTSPVERKIN